ncbi:MAG: type II toxin-antitoxin system mRNA interferase toxin, RelE/StbE family [Campylobacterales bacterium]|nr:type II toxin-antitoxin system mRNA interferase toxin, RelE/StbE family [Campylobacterales bacterium]
MFNIKQTESFRRNSKKFFKKHKGLVVDFEKFISKLQNNPFEPSLQTHKLKGELKEFWSYSLNYEYRVVLIIMITDKEVTLIDIGSHDEIY